MLVRFSFEGTLPGFPFQIVFNHDTKIFSFVHNFNIVPVNLEARSDF